MDGVGETLTERELAAAVAIVSGRQVRFFVTRKERRGREKWIAHMDLYLPATSQWSRTGLTATGQTRWTAWVQMIANANAWARRVQAAKEKVTV